MYLVALTLCVVVGLRVSAADLVVIDLQNRTADDLMPALKPLVGPDVALSGIDYKLLVRGSATEIAKVKQAVAVLDKAPRQLLVSVRYTGAPDSSSNNASVGVGNSIVVRGGTTTRTGIDASTSSVRVLEGNSAHISTGQSVPIVTAFIPTEITGRGGTVGIATDYRDVSSGFNVKPRINGSRVFLEVSTRQERLTDSQGLNVQRADTTISGNLGEWIELGGVSSSSSEQRTSVGLTGGSRRVTTDSDQRSISIKVDAVQ